MTDFDVRCSMRGETTVLELMGEIDLQSAPKLRETILATFAAGRCRLVVDMSRVDFIDSTGLGILVGAHNRAGADGGFVRIATPSARVERVIKLTGLAATLRTWQSIDEAIDRPTSERTPGEPGE